MSRELLVQCVDVARTFGAGPRAVVAVHGASCRVYAGDRIAVMGSSGSGKSTLLHLIAGLEPPTAGAVTWPGLDPDPLIRARQVGVAFQGPSLLPSLDVVENVAVPLLIAGNPLGSAWADALAAVVSVGLEGVRGHLPEQLSGGQAQRVVIARVLAARPPLILADEPTGQLDAASGQRAVFSLIEVADQVGAALVVCTHDREVAAAFPVRWEMDEGRLRTTEGHPAGVA
ncbi:MAG: ATP-binding cassette domain-containing protein [Actinomycetota bacterium]|nr:ATP-binding cassette domain-containing protein [Actinomycetota bacterium]